MLGTEQPNENQSAFGPSNLSTSFSDPNQNVNQGQPGVNNQQYMGATNCWGPSAGSPAWNEPSQDKNPWGTANTQTSGGGALPWQNNDTQPMSAPSWNVGHDGSQNNMNREQYRDSWMSSGVSNNQGMDAWLAANGGQRMNDAGVVRTPYGEILDMGMAFKTGNGKPAWTDIGMNNMGQSPVQQPSPNSGIWSNVQSPFGPSQQGNTGIAGAGWQNSGQQINLLQELMRTNPSMFMQQPGNMHTTGQGIDESGGYNFNQGGNSSNMDISSFLGPSAGMMDQRYGALNG